MQKLLFAKIEVWLLLVLLLLGSLAAIAFGATVLKAERAKLHPGRLALAAQTIAEIPSNFKRMFGKDTSLLAYEPPALRGRPAGWSFPGGVPAGLDGYLLLSRYDGTRRRHAIELVAFPRMTVVHSWIPDATALLEGASRTSQFADYANWDTAHFRAIHPVLLANGDIITKDHYSPAFRLDSCGKRLWINDKQVFHHSTEIDADGNLWLPSLAEPHRIKGARDSFREDTLVEITPGGKLLYDKSVTQILLDHGMADALFTNGMYNDDPTHLNDIEPVLADGPYWKRGDVFLSLRNISTVMLYRPSTGAIVWQKRGPWIAQHDVDILDDHRIGIYDNAAQDRGRGEVVEGNSDIMVFDFATGTVTSPLKAAMQASNIKTFAAGLFTVVPGGFTIVEDVTNARLVIYAAGGKVAADYVNRADDKSVYHLGWSRYIGKAEGDAALAQIRKVTCHV